MVRGRRKRPRQNPGRKPKRVDLRKKELRHRRKKGSSAKKRKVSDDDEDEDEKEEENGGDDDKEDKKFALGNKRFATVNEFKGTTLVDIREYFQDKQGEWKPGKKGISLKRDEFNKLLACAPKIQEKFDE
jgi:hypothetical protein